MKTQTQKPIVTTAQAQPVEVVRSVAQVETLLSISGDKVTIPKGCDVTPAELAEFIADRDSKARTYGAQARWTWHAIGSLPDADAKREQIKAALADKLSKSALYQLTSEAETLCPLIEREAIKAPLSLLKDAKAALLVDEKTGKLAPMAKQSKAARALIPLLKSGEVTQAKIREIRKANATPAPSKGPTAKDTPASKDAKDAAAFGLALGQAKAVQTYLNANKLSGDDRQQFVNIVTDCARQLGLSLA